MGKPPTTTDYNFGKVAKEEGKIAAIYNLTQLMKLQLHIVTELAVFYRFSNKLAIPYDKVERAIIPPTDPIPQEEKKLQSVEYMIDNNIII